MKPISWRRPLDCFASLVMTAELRYREEPTGPARSGRPDDKLRDAAIQIFGMPRYD